MPPTSQRLQNFLPERPHQDRSPVVGALIRAVAIGWLCVTASVQSAGAAEPVRLKYLGHLDGSLDDLTHYLLGIDWLGENLGLISGSGDLVLIDLDALTDPGATAKLAQLSGFDFYSSVTHPDDYVFANIRLDGFAVVRLDRIAHTLTLRNVVAEPGVFYDKMTIDGDRLYVAAHAHGIRVFDVTEPEAPELIAWLEEGFVDAFAIAVDGDTVYVADGAGGLKIVDFSDESVPVIVAGETPATAAGTAEDVLVIGDRVYVAAGGAGIAVYETGHLDARTLYDTPTCAKALARVGNHLAVADIGGLEVFAIEPDGSLTRVAGESAFHRAKFESFSVRLWHGVCAWGDDTILAADWDSMNAYALVDPALDDQADVTASTQRVRFTPGGGVETVRISNDGSGTLNITDVYATSTRFELNPTDAVIAPGQFIDLTITYTGGQPGSGLVYIDSNDPDENPLPIEVHGNTAFLDPAEPAIPFTLEAWTFNHQAREYEYSLFDIESHAGRILYFHVFGVF